MRSATAPSYDSLSPRRLVTVLLPMLPGVCRDRVREDAEAAGFVCAFCESEAEARALLPETEIYFGPGIPLDGGADRLRWIALPSAGIEPFHRSGALPEGVALTNAAGAYGVTIAEHIVMVTLEMMRRRADYLDIVARREWRRDLPIRAIHGTRVVIVGTGDIGREAARRLRAFAPAEITGVSRSGVCSEPLFDRMLPVSRIEEALPGAELLILCIPGTPETRDLLDARRLALLPEGAFLVNVGRGNCLDEDAVRAALREGRLAGAALDVFRQEPLPADSPLWETPGLMVTPHISGNMTLDWTLERVVGIFTDNLKRYAAGKPLTHRVEPARGY